MTLRTHLLLLGATFAVGLGSGWLIGRESGPVMPSTVSSRSSGTRVEASGDNQTTDLLSLHIRKIRRDRPVAAPTARQSPAVAVSIAPAALADLVLSSPVPLEERGVLFGGADPVANALGMNESEKKELEVSWQRTRDHVVKQQLGSLEYEQLDGSLWISSDSFDGAALREQFFNDTSQILGAERAEAMWRLLKAEQAFGEWGSKRSSACSLEYIRQGDGSLVYRITERSAPEAPPRRTWISAELPTHLHEAAEHLGLPVRPPQ